MAFFRAFDAGVKPRPGGFERGDLEVAEAARDIAAKMFAAELSSTVAIYYYSTI